MVTVQGSFVPAGATGFFFLWGLDATLGSAPARRGRHLPLHPQVLPAGRLYPILRGIPYLNGVTCVQFLPMESGLQPVRLPGIALSVGSSAQWLLGS